MRVLGVNAVFHDPAAALVVDGSIVAAAEEERFSRRKHGKAPVPFSHLGAARAGDGVVPGRGRPRAVRPRRGRLLLRPGPRAAARRRHDRRRVGGAADALRPARAALPGQRPPRARPGRVRFVPHHVAHAASAARRGRLGPAAPCSCSTAAGSAASHLAGVRRDGRLRGPRRRGAPALARAASTRSSRRTSASGARQRRVQGHGDGVLRGAARTSTSCAASCAPTGAAAFVTEPVDWARWAPPLRARRGVDGGPRRARRQRAGAPGGGAGRPRRRGCTSRRARRAWRWPAASRSTAWPTRASGARARSSEVWVQPASGDSGTALGRGARGRARARATRIRPCAPPRWAAPGTTTRSAGWLRTAAVEFERPDDVADAVAATLAADGVVAWFQGRSEFGPRALGHRSLLADPRSAGEHRAPQRRQGARAVPPRRADGPRRARRTRSSTGRRSRRPYMLFTHEVRPRVARPDPRRRPRRRHRAHPDRRPRRRAARGPHARGLRARAPACPSWSTRA